MNKLFTSIIILSILIISACSSTNTDPSKQKKIYDENGKEINPAGVPKKLGGGGSGKSSYFLLGIPKCPDNIEGILTSPFVNPDDLSSIVPLGNIAPPGHTSPVDHNYFNTLKSGKVPLFAPADSTINSVIVVSQMNEKGEYIPLWYTMNFIICNGIELTFANYNELTPEFKAKLPKSTDECKFGIIKDGHDFTEGQCYYKDLKIKVKAGEKIGWTWVDKRGLLPFECWAANYNKPIRADVNWDYYNDDRYAHSMCLFDLYTKDIKDKFYEKFGGGGINHTDINQDAISEGKQALEPFTQRTIEPRCGQVNQNIADTLQGMWFGDSLDMAGAIEYDGKGLSFIHNNIDPTIAEIGVGGNFMKTATIMFTPTHEGLINREFSEVKADGTIYCYQAPSFNNKDGKDASAKIIVQLINSNKITVEYQSGDCLKKEQFTKPFEYFR